MNYLIYIEHAAENLQFYLWYRDYIKRFDQTPASERALAPEWTAAQAEAALEASQVKTHGGKGTTISTSDLFKNTDFANGPKTPFVTEHSSSDPFSTPPRSDPRTSPAKPPMPSPVPVSNGSPSQSSRTARRSHASSPPT
jgi:hypothetical protein